MKQVDDIIKYIISKNITPSINYLVIKDNQIFYNSFGYKNIYTKEEVDINSLYDLASLTKIFTATLMCILYEKDLVSFDDSVSKYIPEFKHPKIKIYDLLTHTSGIINRIDYRNLTKEEYLEKLFNIDLTYENIKTAYYSDLNYILLGLIIERILNDRLDNIMNELIFKPLDMFSTCFNPRSSNVVATELTKERFLINGFVHDEKSYLLGGITGHAGLFSNVLDLSKFSIMILNDGIYKNKRLLKKETIDNWFKPIVFDNVTLQMRSFSWIVGNNYLTKKCSKKTITHTGFTGTSILIDKEFNISIIILSNRIHPSRENNKYKIYRKLITDIIYENILDMKKEKN